MIMRQPFCCHADHITIVMMIMCQSHPLSPGTDLARTRLPREAAASVSPTLREGSRSQQGLQHHIITIIVIIIITITIIVNIQFHDRKDFPCNENPCPLPTEFMWSEWSECTAR